MVSYGQSYNIVIRKYEVQHYYTYFDKQKGFFARIEEPGYDDPFWAMHGPEILDISITNWCDRNCSFCYRNSHNLGEMMSLGDYEQIISQAATMHVSQVALGGGNPNQHPEFSQILQITKEKYGIVPTYTTNGRGLSTSILNATKNYCGAVAVSAYPPYDELKDAINMLTSYSIKTNIHFLLTSDSIETAINWIKKPPDFLDKVNAIVFLNYKPVGRNITDTLLLNKTDKVSEFFKLVQQYKGTIKIGFDSCTISGVAKYLKTDTRFLDACEAARFSAFISEDMKIYPCSFMVQSNKGIDLKKVSLLDAWQKGHDFIDIRDKLKNDNCPDCEHKGLCLGGCPVFRNINLCE